MSDVTGSPASDSDALLLATMQNGNEQALGLLYDRYGSLTYALAYRILQDRGVAEEVVQDVFLRAWRGAATFQQERGSVRTWLLALAYHRAIDRLRGKDGRARDVLWLDDVPARVVPGADPWEAIDRTVLREQLQGALARLSLVQRQAVELAYFGGYSGREIADRQAVALGTAKGRLRLGLQALQRALGQELDEGTMARGDHSLMALAATPH